jgi:hypothetical protein
MRAWLKAAAVAALVAWLLMGGLDFLETHYYAMKWMQLDTIEWSERFTDAIGGR